MFRLTERRAFAAPAAAMAGLLFAAGWLHEGRALASAQEIGMYTETALTQAATPAPSAAPKRTAPKTAKPATPHKKRPAPVVHKQAQPARKPAPTVRKEAPVAPEVRKEKELPAGRVLSHTDRMRLDLLVDASKYLGTPYIYGAKYGQTGSFDCSSFVKTVFAENGFQLPRVSREQALKGTPIRKSELKAGDLLFFTTKDHSNEISHVGIYSGNGMMIHTYGDGGVKYSSIEKGYWKDRYVTARRLILDPQG